MNRSTLYPYVVPESYFALDLPAPAPTSWKSPDTAFHVPLGHGIYKMLISFENNLIRKVHEEDLGEAGLTITRAYEIAFTNLKKALNDAGLQTQVREDADGPMLLAWFGHWLTASCLVLPNLHEMVSPLLKEEEVCVVAPQQQFLFFFPKRDRPFRDMMRAFVRKTVEGMDKRISEGWFRVTPRGIEPLNEAE